MKTRAKTVLLMSAAWALAGGGRLAVASGGEQLRATGNEPVNGLSISSSGNNAPIGKPLIDSRALHTNAFPTLARISKPNGNHGMKSLSGCCHILLFYGRGPTDLRFFTSGELALRALTNEEAAKAAFGSSPFFRTRNGIRYLLSEDPIFQSDVGEAHQDQCLATFAALDLPLSTTIQLITKSYSISNLLSETVANFAFDQKELAWTAITLAKYVPPSREWTNRFGDRTSFSLLVQNFLQRKLTRESCAGTHIFQALLRIRSADLKYSIVDSHTRTQLNSYLTAKIQELVRLQNADGSWSKKWCDSVDEDIGGMTPFEMSLIGYSCG